MKSFKTYLLLTTGFCLALSGMSSAWGMKVTPRHPSPRYNSNIHNKYNKPGSSYVYVTEVYARHPIVQPLFPSDDGQYRSAHAPTHTNDSYYSNPHSSDLHRSLLNMMGEIHNNYADRFEKMYNQHKADMLHLHHQHSQNVADLMRILPQFSNFKSPVGSPMSTHEDQMIPHSSPQHHNSFSAGRVNKESLPPSSITSQEGPIVHINNSAPPSNDQGGAASNSSQKVDAVYEKLSNSDSDD